MTQVLQYDPNVPVIDFGDHRMVAPNDVEAAALFHGVPIIGFSGSGEEYVRAAMSRIPPELLSNVSVVKAEPGLQPKHGRYDPDEKAVCINPLIFNLRQRFGKGQGWIIHTELTIAHEIGHSVYHFLPELLKDQWREISGWSIGTQDGQSPPYEEKRPGWPHGISKWTHKPGVKFTRKYAQKNDAEDFADSFAFFMLSKPHQMAPAKRKFLEAMVAARVKAYPQAAIQGPDRPYGEKHIQAGGPGSGCNPEVADPGCGRPAGNTISKPPDKNPFRGGRGHGMLEHLKDGNWHKMETVPQGKRQSALFWAMRPALRKIGYNIIVRKGMVRLVKNDEPVAEKKSEPKVSVGHQFELFPEKSDERETRLRNAKVIEVSENQEGGASESKIVLLEDGSRAVFKPTDGQYAGDNFSRQYSSEREVGAWEVAKVVGLDKNVATVIRTSVEGEDGVLIEFQKGQVANRFDVDEMFDGARDATRAAAFDYVIGNVDRHSGNWLVEPSADSNPEHYKLHLIDHNLIFPDVYDGVISPRSKFLYYVNSMERLHNPRAIPPADVAKVYVDLKDTIASTMKRLGLPDSAISGVKSRIDSLGKAKKWQDLRIG